MWDTTFIMYIIQNVSTYTLYFCIVHVYAFVISVKVKGLFELNRSFADLLLFAQISYTLDLVIKRKLISIYIFAFMVLSIINISKDIFNRSKHVVW